MSVAKIVFFSIYLFANSVFIEGFIYRVVVFHDFSLTFHVIEGSI